MFSKRKWPSKSVIVLDEKFSENKNTLAPTIGNLDSLSKTLPRTACVGTPCPNRFKEDNKKKKINKCFMFF
jgi:hypothetical protein